MVAITAGYLAIDTFGFDYARWVSNWAVCMALVMFATHLLPLATPAPAPSVAGDTTQNLALGLDRNRDPTRWHHGPVLSTPSPACARCWGLLLVECRPRLVTRGKVRSAPAGIPRPAL